MTALRESPHAGPARLDGMTMRSRLLSVAVATFLMLGASDAPPRRPMEDLSGGLTAAFRAGLHDDRDSFGKALQRLSDGSGELLAHGEGFGKTTERIRTAIARDVATAVEEFDAGRFDAAERRVHQLLDHCFACHTRLPAGESALGDRISRGVDTAGMTLRDRVFFLVATRQFDRALAATEAALRSPGDTGKPTAWLFEAYLKLALRVGGAHARARTTLTAYLEHVESPPYLRARISSWIEALDALDKRGELVANPTAARALIDEGRRRNAFPADKRGLVHFVTASGLLLRFVEDHEGAAAETAEAYYLLGITESYISSTLWTEQTEFFVDTAIRLQPHSALAAEAYGFLNEYVVARYSSASETHVPDQVQQLLDELEALAGPRRQ